MLSGWTMPGDGARRGLSRRAAEPQANLLTRLELLMVFRELQPVGGPRGPPDTNVKTLPPWQRVPHLKSCHRYLINEYQGFLMFCVYKVK